MGVKDCHQQRGQSQFAIQSLLNDFFHPFHGQFALLCVKPKIQFEIIEINFCRK